MRGKPYDYQTQRDTTPNREVVGALKDGERLIVEAGAYLIQTFDGTFRGVDEKFDTDASALIAKHKSGEIKSVPLN